MITTLVPIAMPIARMVREYMFLPVTTKTIAAIPEIVSISQIVSIPELASDVTLIPYARRGWISVIRKSRETIGLTRLSNGCRNVST
jgi:hypothetical protein